MRARVVTERWAEGRSRPLLLSIDLRAARITATGELDRAVAHRLADALAALPLTGHSTWTVDAAGLSFCDAEGLRVIAAGAALAESRGCTLRLADPSPFVTRLLGMVGMAELIDGAVSRDAGRSPLGAA